MQTEYNHGWGLSATGEVQSWSILLKRLPHCHCRHIRKGTLHTGLLAKQSRSEHIRTASDSGHCILNCRSRGGLVGRVIRKCRYCELKADWPLVLYSNATGSLIKWYSRLTSWKWEAVGFKDWRLKAQNIELSEMCCCGIIMNCQFVASYN